MINIKDGELKDILPAEFTRRPEIIALSYAIKRAYERYLPYMDRILIYADIDNAPENALDLLAVELNTRYYSNDYPLETKRKLIKTALLTATKDGTAYAVNTVLEQVWGNGKTVDWYDYGGTPNHFRIELESAEDLDLIDTITKTIESVKRKTARLDEIIVKEQMNSPLYFGSIIMEEIPVYITCPDAPGGNIEFLADENGTILADENGGMLFMRKEVSG